MVIKLLIDYFYTTQFVYQLLATLATYSTISVIHFIIIRRRRHQLFRYYGIPGPKPSLLKGNLGHLRANAYWYKFLDDYRVKYGDVVGFYVGDEPSIIIYDLDILKKVFFDLVDSFKERSTMFMSTPLDDGILFAKHNRWKFFRKAMSPMFTSYQVRGETSTMFIEEAIKLMLEYIEQKLESSDSKGDTLIDIHDLMKATALRMIASMALQIPVEVKENEENVRSLDAFMGLLDKGLLDLAISFPLLASVFSFLARHFEQGNALSFIRRSLRRRIDQGLSWSKNKEPLNQQERNVMDLLIKLHRENKITRAEVMGNAEALLFAGYDTTSTSLTYLFWVLGKHPEVQEQLRIELSTHGIDSKYLELVINETMRLYPAVISFTTRLATKTVQIGDLVIPQGAKVLYNSRSIHLDPKVWPNPTKFDPERFADLGSMHPCAFGPFGFGERKCLGYNLALLELKMILCSVLLKYRVKLKSPQNLELISYAVVTSKPKEKVIIQLERL